MYRGACEKRDRGANHFVKRGVATGKNQFIGASPYSLGSGKPWPWLGLHLLGHGARIDRFRGTPFSTRSVFAEAFLHRVWARSGTGVGIVPDRDVRAHHLLAHTVIQTGALVGDGGRREIVKRSRRYQTPALKDHSVVAGRASLACATLAPFPTRGGEGFGIEFRKIG